MRADPASFRDPAGRVYLQNGRVLRTVAAEALSDFEYARANPTLRRLIDDGAVIESREIAPAEAPLVKAAKIVEHPRLPFISYPYEWSFSLLKAAALHHLDLQIALLESGVALTDAAAYNIQFIGVRPIFIDPLSFSAYREGEYWLAHRQFCEQFLNPLLMHALLGAPHNEWYRGALDGIPTATLARLLPARRKLSWRVMTHVVLPARLQSAGGATAAAFAARPLPKFAYLGLLQQLRRWIAGLRSRCAGRSVWSDYTSRNSYDGAQTEAKRRFIAEFAAAARPRLLWDFGCNTGEYAETALANGAASVIGFDFDHGALEGAYARAQTRNLAFLPLFQDAANPSPAQGWGGEERSALAGRKDGVDALSALAFIHHVALGRNVPLDRALDWLTDLAPQGVLEFVPKSDPMAQRLLALRKDIFPDYGADSFLSLLAARARIVRQQRITESGRLLVVYDRR